MKKLSAASILFGAALFLTACGGDSGSAKVETKSTEKTDPAKNITWKTIEQYPHSMASFTEGFLFHDSLLFESTGSPNYLPQTHSVIGVLDLTTGELETRAELDRKQFFGEGMTILNGKVYQLTYQSRKGFVYNYSDFKKLGEFTIPTKEGWGMTTDGEYLIMSDGTHRLRYLDPNTLEVVKTMNVSRGSYVQQKLNELEYVNGYIYANVWMDNEILKIEAATGKVVGKIDLSILMAQAKNTYPKALEMNGIAYQASTGHFFITGKMWPYVFEIALDDAV
ncbi:MAG: glutamine cyclotransferase [Crocinitomicaceae bacterium]|nr:glutamine cyclotransferase [Crocinitomicaceae bacterium]|tara:strand:+ start:10458 stop:11297 length:840 start_codon:yes stop_codon:yes gene_type:complete